jgi:acyl carrier protein
VQTIDDETARIIKVVAAQLEIDPSRISETDHLVEDLEADSLTLVSVLAGLEQEFRVSIETEEIPRMTDVRGIRAVLADATGWLGAATTPRRHHWSGRDLQHRHRRGGIHHRAARLPQWPRPARRLRHHGVRPFLGVPGA